MSDINTVVLTGRLTRDPERKTTSGGMTVVNFTLAVDDWISNAKATHFIDCTMFGKRADAMANYVVKGQSITIQGKLRQETWEAKEGGKRSKLSVLANDFQMHGKGGQGAQKPQREAEYALAPDNDKDVPF